MENENLAIMIDSYDYLLLHKGKTDDNQDIEYTDDSTEYYLREINRYPLLTKEEEVELFKRLATGEIGIRQKIIESNLRLVVSIARKYNNLGVDFLDLIQYGNEGLIKAVDGYDADRNNCFSTYAYWKIKQSIRYAIYSDSRLVHLPTYLVDKSRKSIKIEDSLQVELKREPTYKEIAEKMGISVEELQQLRQVFNPIISLESDVDDFKLDTLTDGTSLEETVINETLKADLLELVKSKLSENQQQVIISYFGFNGEKVSLREMSRRSGVLHGTLSARKKSAIKKLKFYKKSLERYL